MKPGFFLGTEGAGLCPDRPVIYSGDGHLLLSVETGGGKGRRVIIPTLITYPGSVESLDLKSGENCRLTALYRHHCLGQNVQVFDPFSLVPDELIPVGSRVQINPIDFIINAPRPASMSSKIAELLIESSLNDKHWAVGGQTWLAGVKRFVAFDPALDDLIAAEKEYGEGGKLGRNMRTVWEIMTNPDLEKWAYQHMLKSSDAAVRDQARTFYKASKANNELSSIRNQPRTALTKAFSEPAMIEAMDCTTADLSRPMREPATIYYVWPADEIESLKPVMRLFMGLAQMEAERVGLREHGSKQLPTLRILDEFASLGKWPGFAQTLSRVRGYGIRYLLALQNLSALKVYGDDAGAIRGNVQCMQYFGGTNDEVTAEAFSKLGGERTIIAPSTSQIANPGDGGIWSSGLMGRKNYLPDEASSLPMPRQLLKLSGEQIVEAHVIDTDLGYFPRYVAFMAHIKGGMAPAMAAQAVKALPAMRPFRCHEPEPVRVPTPPRRSLFNVVADGLSELFGLDTK